MLAHLCLPCRYAEGLTHCNRQKHFLSNLLRAKLQWGLVVRTAQRQVQGQSCLPFARNSSLDDSLVSNSGISKIVPKGTSFRMVLSLQFAGPVFLRAETELWLICYWRNGAGKCWLRNEWMNGWMAIYAAIRSISKIRAGDILRLYPEVGSISWGEGREESDSKSNPVTSQLFTFPDQPGLLQKLIWSSGLCPQRAWLGARKFHFVIPAISCSKTSEQLSSEDVTYRTVKVKLQSLLSIPGLGVALNDRNCSQMKCCAVPGLPWTRCTHVSCVKFSGEGEPDLLPHEWKESRRRGDCGSSDFITTPQSPAAALISLLPPLSEELSPT